VKFFCKSVNIWQSYGQEYGVLVIWFTVYKQPATVIGLATSNPLISEITRPFFMKLETQNNWNQRCCKKKWYVFLTNTVYKQTWAVLLWELCKTFVDQYQSTPVVPAIKYRIHQEKNDRNPVRQKYAMQFLLRHYCRSVGRSLSLSVCLSVSLRLRLPLSLSSF